MPPFRDSEWPIWLTWAAIILAIMAWVWIFFGPVFDLP